MRYDVLREPIPPELDEYGNIISEVCVHVCVYVYACACAYV